ncbi:hypothetical protein C5167_008239 [Papaver somniferum]|uniref:Argonaute linker 2 domain-containing protein n=1 Tax=Papaver somniferum TaxID=3469 RepID=A0A4Y7JWX6_PAPSO|nr:hypothetical protein C5167_008239 [Papaver somniferum]
MVEASFHYFGWVVISMNKGSSREGFGLHIKKALRGVKVEVCKIVEGQRYSKRLDERQITALLKVTCGRPRERVKDIMQNVRHNAYYEDPFAKKSGIKTSDKLAQVGARILPSPWDQFDTMYFSDNESYVMYSRPHFLDGTPCLLFGSPPNY